MKKYYIFGLIFTAVLFVSIISPRLFTQSYRLTKVGYIDLQRVIKEVTSDQELADKLKEKQEEYKQQNSTEDNSENSILYADRTFDITESVIADVKASLKK